MIKSSVWAILAFFVSSFLSVSSVSAKDCKGLSESQCSSNDDCTWVKGYQTKDGVKVDDYCRAKPGKGDKSDKKDKKDKSDKKDKKNKKDKSDKKEKKDKKDKSDKKDKKKKDKD
ncbi:MAG TPA: hypothetical protein PL048_07795 [Leptospiraceae bacterium]|nr:hypothetical protein [Leptospiraceae bacterium]HMY70099.1 hypothetical protein [Leptospiraceae bacterium]HMZ58663.1 hypothetical protein [Leptospiraceae bacterium]HNF17132.1 hypothetical protein [Leptospiraceae bacterium]HNF24737.1 hypothetical protein [Leptospiraceae bacterium]